MKNKKLKTSKKNRSKILIVGLIVALVGGALFILNRSHGDTSSTIAAQDRSAESSAQDSATKQEFIESNNKTDNGSSGQEQDLQGQSSKRIELSAQDSGNGSVTVFTKLYGYSSGTCTLKSTNSGRSDVQEAEVIYERAFSSCAGFSVDKASLGSGVWKISLTLKSANEPASQEISLEVN